MTQHQRKTNRPLSPTTAYLESRSTASTIGVMTSLRSHVILLAVFTRFPLFMWMSFKLTFFWDKLEYFTKSFTKTVLCDWWTIRTNLHRLPCTFIPVLHVPTLKIYSAVGVQVPCYKAKMPKKILANLMQAPKRKTYVPKLILFVLCFWECFNFLG